MIFNWINSVTIDKTNRKVTKFYIKYIFDFDFYAI